jgi:hypothetical protein
VPRLLLQLDLRLHKRDCALEASAVSHVAAELDPVDGGRTPEPLVNFSAVELVLDHAGAVRRGRVSLHESCHVLRRRDVIVHLRPRELADAVGRLLDDAERRGRDALFTALTLKLDDDPFAGRAEEEAEGLAEALTLEGATLDDGRTLEVAMLFSLLPTAAPPVVPDESMFDMILRQRDRNEIL